MTIIKTKDFILRPIRMDDAENIYTYQQESEAKKNFMTVPKNIAEVKKDILKKHKNSEGFVIDIDGAAIGQIGVYDIIKGHKATISYWLAKEYRGKGISTSAVKVFTDYIFKKYGLVRINGNVRTFNKASARVLEKAGYKLEGIMRKNKFKDGKYLDDMV